MRYIRRSRLPAGHDFVRWRTLVVSTGQATYGNLSDGWPETPTTIVKAKRSLIESLLDSQGHLCAYTGLRATPDDVHLDHIKPQDLCSEAGKTYGEDLDELNLVVAVPKSANPKTHPFGPHHRGNWFKAAMVAPNDPTCESRLRYTLTGKVEPRNHSDAEAAETIEKFALDHEILNEMRKQAIRGYRKRQFWQEDLDRLVSKFCSPAPGVLDEFSSAIIGSSKPTTLE